MQFIAWNNLTGIPSLPVHLLGLKAEMIREISSASVSSITMELGSLFFKNEVKEIVFTLWQLTEL